MISWRPSAPVTTEGYQRPTDMSGLRVQVSVHGSKISESLAPVPPLPPRLPPKTPSMPLGRKEWPEQKNGTGRGWPRPSGMSLTGGVTCLKASGPVPLAGSQRKARPAFSLPMVWVGAGSFSGLVSIRSKENSSTLPVGSRATWSPKSGEGKYCLNAPNVAGSKALLWSAWEAVSALYRLVRVVCG